MSIKTMGATDAYYKELFIVDLVYVCSFGADSHHINLEHRNVFVAGQAKHS